VTAADEDVGWERDSREGVFVRSSRIRSVVRLAVVVAAGILLLGSAGAAMAQGGPPTGRGGANKAANKQAKEAAKEAREKGQARWVDRDTQRVEETRRDQIKKVRELGERRAARAREAGDEERAEKIEARTAARIEKLEQQIEELREESERQEELAKERAELRRKLAEERGKPPQAQLDDDASEDE
jgi:hypothetical protein